MTNKAELESYCVRLSKKNNSILYKLEKYLGYKMLTNEELIEIRDIILTVSAEISKIPSMLQESGEKDERLQ